MASISSLRHRRDSGGPRLGRWRWVDDVAIVPCMGGVTLLAVRANGHLEISGPGWKSPSARTRRILGVSPRIPAKDCGVNHVCRLGNKRRARRLATALAQLLVEREAAESSTALRA